MLSRGGRLESTYLDRDHPESVRLRTRGQGVKMSEYSAYVLCEWTLF